MARQTKAGRTAKAPGGSSVEEFLDRLEHPRKKEILALRALVLAADEKVTEAVKWNAPSFLIHDHFATFKLVPTDTVQVVLHTGTKGRPLAAPLEIDDPHGLLKWAAKDRCVATFRDMRQVEAHKTAFARLLRQWIEQTAP